MARNRKTDLPLRGSPGERASGRARGFFLSSPPYEPNRFSPSDELVEVERGAGARKAVRLESCRQQAGSPPPVGAPRRKQRRILPGVSGGIGICESKGYGNDESFPDCNTM